MNVKKAKLLRQIVRATASDRELLSYQEQTSQRRYRDVEKISGDGKSTYVDKEPIATGPIRVNPTTQRGIYRALKRGLTVKERCAPKISRPALAALLSVVMQRGAH